MHRASPRRVASLRHAPTIALLLLPVIARAQDATAVCTAIREVRVGYWAQYRITTPGEDGAAGTLRNAIVDTVREGDRTLLWHETEFAQESGMILQSLVPGYPFEPSEVEAVVMQAPGEPPVRMPDEMVAMMQRAQPDGDPMGQMLTQCTTAATVGWETITTDAGDVRAIHLRPVRNGDTTEVWLAPDVPFGVVRVSGQGVELMLLGYGTDATSQITERPRNP